MEKTIFFFHKHLDRDRENFARHYIGNHAPLGKRLTRSLRGYTVNIVQSDSIGGPDAVTEHWANSALDIVTPSIAYATDEDLQAVATDDRTLFHGMAEPYIVTNEVERISERSLDGPLEQQTPGFKLVWTYPSRESVPAPPSGAYRVVDSFIDHKLGWQDLEVHSKPSEVAVIRMAWTDDLGRIGDAADGAIVAHEYRFIEPPAWH